MRSLKPLCLTAAVALALAGTSAMAATTTARLSGAGTTTSTTAATTSTTATTPTRTTAGGCAGTNGSTCTATTSPDANAAGSTVTTTTNSPPGVPAPPATSGTTTTSTNNSAGDTVPPVRSGQGTNSVNVDPTLSRPGAFDPGGAFGPAAVPATATNGTLEGGIVLPTTGATTGSQQNVFVQPAATPSGTTLMNTPIFDQAARNGQAREARRRAAGDEPRVIGIAPRTERDLTWQMPDDPIIRY